MPVWLPMGARRLALPFLAAMLLEVGATALQYVFTLLFPGFGLPAMLNILAVALIALTFGGAPSALAALVGSLLTEYIVMEPNFTFNLRNAESMAEFSLLLVVGLAISVLASRNEVSRRKAVQLADTLASERQRLDTIIDAVPDTITIHDARGRFIRRNRTAESALSVGPPINTLDDLAASYELSDATGATLDVAEYPATRALRGEVLPGMELHYRDPLGTERDVIVSAAPLHDQKGVIDGAVTVTHNITERRQLEQRTHETLEALLSLAQSLVVSAIDQEEHESFGYESEDLAEPEVFDRQLRAAAHHIATITCRVLGCSRVGIVAVEPLSEQLRAVAVVGLAPADEKRWWREQRQQQERRARLGDGADTEQLARFRAGEVFVIDMTQPPYNQAPNPYHVTTSLAAPMRAEGTLMGILSLDFGGTPHAFTPQEVTLAGAVARFGAYVLERERLLRERAEAISSLMALQEANKRMDRFVSIAGHELRTPLTTARMNLQLAQRHLTRLAGLLARRDPSEGATAAERDARPAIQKAFGDLHAMIERMESAAARQERLINDLLSVSRIGTGKLELVLDDCDLVALTRDVVQEQRMAHDGRTIQLIAPRNAIPIHADADRISQVITNYLTNALKYSPAHRAVLVRVRRSGDSARVEVKDYGVGIPAKYREQVWEIFNRVPGIEVQSGSGVGLGLGLHIARELIERHSGRVGVESDVGKGSTFWFTIPLADAAAERAD